MGSSELVGRSSGSRCPLPPSQTLSVVTLPLCLPSRARGKGPWVSELPEIWGYFGWVPEVRSPPDCRLLGGSVHFGFASPPCSETPGTEQVLREESVYRMNE